MTPAPKQHSKQPKIVLCRLAVLNNH